MYIHERILALDAERFKKSWLRHEDFHEVELFPPNLIFIYPATLLISHFYIYCLASIYLQRLVYESASSEYQHII